MGLDSLIPQECPLPRGSEIHHQLSIIGGRENMYTITLSALAVVKVCELLSFQQSRKLLARGKYRYGVEWVDLDPGSSLSCSGPPGCPPDGPPSPPPSPDDPLSPWLPLDGSLPLPLPPPPDDCPSPAHPPSPLPIISAPPTLWLEPDNVSGRGPFASCQ